MARTIETTSGPLLIGTSKGTVRCRGIDWTVYASVITPGDEIWIETEAAGLPRAFIAEALPVSEDLMDTKKTLTHLTHAVAGLYNMLMEMPGREGFFLIREVHPHIAAALLEVGEDPDVDRRAEGNEPTAVEVTVLDEDGSAIEPAS